MGRTKRRRRIRKRRRREERTRYLLTHNLAQD